MDMKNLVTLEDGNQYLVASKVNYEGQDYYYLVDINNNANLMFCYVEDGEVVELNDKELTTKLLPLFVDVAKDVLEEFKGQK